MDNEEADNSIITSMSDLIEEDEEEKTESTEDVKEEEPADDAGTSDSIEEEEDLDLDETPAEDEDDEEGFEIDPDLEASLDEKNLKRLQNHLKGASKVRKQAESWRKDSDTLSRYNEALLNPETAGQTLKALANGVAQQHGTTLEDLLGIQTEELDWKQEAKKDIVDPAINELKAKLAKLEAIEQKRDENSKLERYLSKALPKAKGLASQRWPGITVTRDELVDAVTRFPELKATPFTAWMKTNGDKIANYKPQAKQPKAREMADSSQSESKPKPIGERTLQDYL